MEPRKRCMDCFRDVQRVPGTTICTKCYAKRMRIDGGFMSSRPIAEVNRFRNLLADEARLRRLERLAVADELEREWMPPLKAVEQELEQYNDYRRVSNG